MDLVGQTVLVGIVATMEDAYKDPTKAVTKLSIDKVFHPETRCTVVELESGLVEGVYVDKWVEANTEPRDKRVQSKEGVTGTGGMPTMSPSASSVPFTPGVLPAGKKPSLFGKPVAE
jgi:hypothetical protein